MVGGINQNVEMLGKVFHVQTEVSETPPYVIRTVVFVSGKVVASREFQLKNGNPKAKSEESIHNLMKMQHEAIIETMVHRAKRYQERMAAEQRLPDLDATVPVPAEAPPVPRAMSDEIGEAIRIRRMFGAFRQNIKNLARFDDQEPRVRLEKAAHLFEAMIESPDFPRIRIDEQVRFNLMKNRIKDWLHIDPDPKRVAIIWGETQKFTAYLTEVNNRSVLIANDRKILAKAARFIGSAGPNEMQLKELNAVFGRDPDLDALLVHPENQPGSRWLRIIDRVIRDLNKTVQGT